MSNIYLITRLVPKILQCGVKVGGLRAPVPGKRMGIKIQGPYTKKKRTVRLKRNLRTIRQSANFQSYKALAAIHLNWKDFWFDSRPDELIPTQSNLVLMKPCKIASAINFFLLLFIKPKDKHFTESSKNSTVFYYITTNG